MRAVERPSSASISGKLKSIRQLTRDTRMTGRTALFLLLSLSPILANAAEPNPQVLHDMVLKLMQETKVLAVSELKVPASEYKADGDPATLEIVTLDKKSDGPSRVTDDGEVIFLNHPSQKEQRDLIAKAFDIRARRKLAGL
jgi:hypothetical protein